MRVRAEGLGEGRVSAPRVVVIGAGVTGLSAARAVMRRADVRVLESSSRAGGLVHTERAADGSIVEHGPDCLMTTKPAGMRVLRELALEGEVLHGTERRAFVLAEQALHPLPAGLLALSPSAGLELLRSPLFSLRAKGRMLLEPLAPRAPRGDDESVGAFFERRLGPEVVARVVDPLLSGIYGAEASRLSMRAVMPILAETERKHRSVAFGIARRDKPAPVKNPMPPVVTLRGGMGALPDALARELAERVRTDAPVRSIERTGAGYRLRMSDGSIEHADAIIVSTPPWHAADLLEALDPELSTLLSAIRPSRLDAVTLAWPREEVPHPLAGTGFVVASSEGRRLRACTWVSRKWPARAPEGIALMRAFVRDGADASDEELVEVARQELRDVLGIDAAPAWTNVTRRARALPRYEVGHLDRVSAIRARADEHLGLALAGNAYDGIGIPDCIASGERAAEAVLGGLA